MAFLETITAASAIIGVGSSLLGGKKKKKQAERAGEEAQRIAQEQRQLAAQQAANIKANAEERVKDVSRQGKLLEANQLVGYLKSGVQLEGTPMDVMAETRKLTAEDIAAIRENANREASIALKQGDIAALEGEYAMREGRRRGRDAFTAGLFDAANFALSAGQKFNLFNPKVK